jgi:uncharacterized protein YbjT (DUF2867 family)
MKLTVVAATGGIGRQVLNQALTQGHDVTAVVRNPTAVTNQARVVTTDLSTPDPAALRSAVAGADAVISGLGPRSAKEAGIASRGTAALIKAMTEAGTTRVLVVSAAPVGTVAGPNRPTPPRHDPGDGFWMRHVFAHVAKAAFGRHYADLAVMEDLLSDSGLAWTVVRPPKLTDKPARGTYRTAVGRNVHGGWSVARADVADFLLAAAADPATEGRIIGMAN